MLFFSFRQPAAIIACLVDVTVGILLLSLAVTVGVYRLAMYLRVRLSHALAFILTGMSIALHAPVGNPFSFTDWRAKASWQCISATRRLPLRRFRDQLRKPCMLMNIMRSCDSKEHCS
jgi:hypothetical protein